MLSKYQNFVKLRNRRRNRFDQSYLRLYCCRGTGNQIHQILILKLILGAHKILVKKMNPLVGYEYDQDISYI